MNSHSVFSFKNITTIILFGLLVMIVTLGITASQTPHYKSSAKLLVIFNQDTMDTYTASRTSNYITSILSEVIYSDSFMTNVFSSNSDLQDNLGYSQEVRQSNWKKIVKVTTQENKGIIMIDTFGNDRKQTNELAETVTNVLIEKHGLYDGSDDHVIIKAIDQPSIYLNWASTKIIRDTVIGFFAGILIGLTFVILLPGQMLYLLFTYPLEKFIKKDETIKLIGQIELASNEPDNLPRENQAADYLIVNEEESQIENNDYQPTELIDENWLYQYYQKGKNDEQQ